MNLWSRLAPPLQAAILLALLFANIIGAAVFIHLLDRMWGIDATVLFVLFLSLAAGGILGLIRWLGMVINMRGGEPPDPP